MNLVPTLEEEEDTYGCGRKHDYYIVAIKN
jgi:hypothetical protein